MGKPVTLLQDICRHVLSLGSDSIEVKHEDGCDRVYAIQNGAGISIAKFTGSGRDATELRQNLYAAAKKPVRAVIAGRVWILKARIHDSLGEDAFKVSIEPAPDSDPANPRKFTAKQGQYLAFIHSYLKIHRRAPAESDLQEYFRVSPPPVHEMIKTLERNGLIARTPGMARSIRLLVEQAHLPPLE